MLAFVTLRLAALVTTAATGFAGILRLVLAIRLSFAVGLWLFRLLGLLRLLCFFTLLLIFLFMPTTFVFVLLVARLAFRVTLALFALGTLGAVLSLGLSMRATIWIVANRQVAALVLLLGVLVAGTTFLFGGWLRYGLFDSHHHGFPLGD